MKRILFTLLTIALACSFLTLAGCGTTKMALRGLQPERGGLRKRVLIAPLVDQAGLGEAKSKEISKAFFELLGNGNHLLSSEATVSGFSDRRGGRSRSEDPVESRSLSLAVESGMNVLITATLNPLDLRFRKIGIWPVVLNRRELEISMIVNVFDVTKGTILLTKLESEALKAKERENSLEVLRELETGKPGVKNPLLLVGEEALQKAISQIVRRQASAVARVLREMPWVGKVLSIDGEDVLISAGRDVGLTVGREFEVFEKGESIKSMTGKNYFLLGPKVGEIKTVRITEQSASAVPLGGARFKIGQLIRLKGS